MKRPGLIRGVLVIGIVYAFNGMLHRLNVHNCAHTYVRVVVSGGNIGAEELCAIETLLVNLHAQEGYTLPECIAQTQAQFPYLYAGTAVFECGYLASYSFICAAPVCI